MLAQVLKVWFIVLFVNGCDDEEMIKQFPYDLRKPEKTFVLPLELTEVSGLSWQNGVLYMVGDEHGTVFGYNAETKEIVFKYQVTGKGDFEGVELIGDQIFVLRSDSRLYISSKNATSAQSTKKIKLDHDDNKNMEGLGYDPLNKQLLLCSKKENLKKDKYRKLFALNATDLEKKPSTLFEFNHGNLKDVMLSNASSKTQRLALQTAYANYSFHPSGVAVHPKSQDIYILSHPKQQILILDKSYQVKFLVPLPSTLFPQPEGICFDEEGNLYISNEGRSGRGFVLFFKN